MNTIRSTWYGWATLCVAGGGAYYFAKQSINKDRQARYEEELRKKNRLARLESSAAFSQRTNETSSVKSRKQPTSSDTSAHETRGLDHAGSPSSEISEDAAPVGHAPVDTEQRTREKSKYEAAEPYRSKKGDRFS